MEKTATRWAHIIKLVRRRQRARRIFILPILTPRFGTRRLRDLRGLQLTPQFALWGTRQDCPDPSNQTGPGGLPGQRTLYLWRSGRPGSCDCDREVAYRRMAPAAGTHSLVDDGGFRITEAPPIAKPPTCSRRSTPPCAFRRSRIAARRSRREHGARDVPGDAHDNLVTGARTTCSRLALQTQD
jgi:hypothetical protein